MVKFSKMLGLSIASVGLLLGASTASAQISDFVAVTGVQSSGSALFVDVDQTNGGLTGTACPGARIFVLPDNPDFNTFTAIALTGLASGGEVQVRGACSPDGSVIAIDLMSINN